MTLPESLDTRAKVKTPKPASLLAVADADVRAEAEEALATAAKTFSIKVLTVNIHKGFTFFNRKFILPELREAVRKIGADVVFCRRSRAATHTTQASLTTSPTRRITSFWLTASGLTLPMAATRCMTRATTATR